MFGDNEPREFTITPGNFLDVLMEWMPSQLDRMRQYESGPIKIGGGLYSLECQYMQTVGGEKFRIVDRTPMGDSGSDYHGSLGADEDIILAFAKRVEYVFASCRRRNEILKTDRPLELNMTFSDGPFNKVVNAARGATG